MGYLRMPEMGRRIENTKMAKFEVPGIKEQVFTTV